MTLYMLFWLKVINILSKAHDGGPDLYFCSISLCVLVSVLFVVGTWPDRYWI